MELGGSQCLPIDKSLFKKYHQPPTVRIRQKQRIAGFNADLPCSWRFSRCQPGSGNQRVVFPAEELHKLGMLISRRTPGPHKCEGSQLMEQQLVVSDMPLLYFQWRHPTATDGQPDCHKDEHTVPSHAPQKIKRLERLCTTPG